MDKETNNQENPSLLPNNTTATAAAAAAIIVPKEESPRKPLSGGGGGGGVGTGDRLKRDEWSEGAVSSLLEAYESKWVLRNRAKLKGHDWEDVARYVSSRANCTKSPKTQTQCKNKIESMKKRYRSESTADASSWPLYSRLDLLLRGNGAPAAAAVAVTVAASAQTHPPPPPPPPMPPSLPPSNNTPLMLLEPTPVAVAPLLQPPGPGPPPQNSHGSNGVERVAKEDGTTNKILSDHASDRNNSMDITSDSSTPALYSEKAEKMRSSSRKATAAANKIMKKKRKRKEEFEVAESIRWLAEAVVKSEQARMEAMRDIERMRVEAEAKRAEMELKRTEIIANTQLEIAKLFASAGHVGKAVDSSLRIGRN
ncbi:Trihelix transcription factor [Trema orientale]|uniref:Trihelix transcription factor n=1 Tax=Trema orientale TaxID=63057 RepID=A0A2P5FLZ0_TREOI|nr:Trihelix transcription factor [Trema orientale]